MQCCCLSASFVIAVGKLFLFNRICSGAVAHNRWGRVEKIRRNLIEAVRRCQSQWRFLSRLETCESGVKKQMNLKIYLCFQKLSFTCFAFKAKFRVYLSFSFFPSSSRNYLSPKSRESLPRFILSLSLSLNRLRCCYNPLSFFFFFLLPSSSFSLV